jgi:hypothetical protein
MPHGIGWARNDFAILSLVGVETKHQVATWSYTSGLHHSEFVVNRRALDSSDSSTIARAVLFIAP